MEQYHASTGTTALVAGIGIDAVRRIIEIARVQLGSDVAFIAEICDDGPAVRWVEGDTEPFAFLRQDGPALAAVCHRILDGSPDWAAERTPGARDAAPPGALSGVPVTLPNGTLYGVLGCAWSRHGKNTNTGAGAIHVLGRAIGRLVQEHGLTFATSARVDAGRIREVLAGGGPGMVFQPIIDIRDGRVAGYEALARFGAEPQRTPDRWFSDAAKVDLGVDLEMAAVQAALQSIHLVPDDAFLSINASPAALMSPEFSLGDVPPNRVVLELVDHQTFEDMRGLGLALSRLGTAGTRIAVDAADGGFSTLSHLLQLAPDIIKLDGLLIRGIDTDPVRRTLARSLVEFASTFGALVAAESVETQGELAMAKTLGVDLAQGNLLGPPAPVD